MSTLSIRNVFWGTVLTVLLAGGSGNVCAQTLVLNGATMTISNGAHLVVDNPASSAIRRNSGSIVSEGEDNVIRWNIGTTTGTYIIPWGYDADQYIPVTFTKTAGTGANGYFLFSTYHTDWQNSTALPSPVTDFNSPSGADKSALAVDRFWQVNAVGYTTKPVLNNLRFTYADNEFLTPNTTTVAADLSLQRWNASAGTWNDFGPESDANTRQRTVTLASVTAANSFAWWAACYVADRHWVSTGNGNWNNTNNWSTTSGGAPGASVPTAVDEVFFDSGSSVNATLNANASVGGFTMDPVYAGTFTQGARTLTVANSATLSGGRFTGGTAAITVGGSFAVEGTTFTSTSGILDVKGDFTVTSGSFNTNNGTIRFSGTTTQSVSSTTPLTFNNLSVTNTSNPGVAIQTDENLAGVLTLGTNARMDADGTKNGAVFTLLSTADSPVIDAAIAALPAGAAIEGNVTVQRYMSIEGAGGGRIYRYIASPLQNATVADFQNEIPVTGSFTGTSKCTGCAKNQSMFYYREAVITDLNKDGVLSQDDGYYDFPDVSNTEMFTPGVGYAVYVRGNILSSARWDLRGQITAGNVTPVSFPVTYTTSNNADTDGWNLVGNPFPATIDWNATGWTKTNINNAVYTRDNGAAVPGVATWNGRVGTNGGSRYISMGQGFWVKAGGRAPVLRANENVKAPTAAATFFREADLSDLLRITLVNSKQRDETVVHFRNDATADFDMEADALKMRNDGFNLSSLLRDGTALAINSLGAMDCSATVNLNIQDVAAGAYSLEFSQFESFPASTTIILTDTWLNQTIDVRAQTHYAFSVTKDAASYGKARFQIAFTGAPARNDFSVLANASVCSGADVTLTVRGAQTEASYTAMLGADSVSIPVTAAGDSVVLTVPGAKLHTSDNALTVVSRMPGCGTAASQAVRVTVMPSLAVRSVGEAKRCGPGEVTLQAISTRDGATFNWYAGEDDAEALVNAHAAAFTTPVLSKSKTYYVSALYGGQCESVRVPVRATVVYMPEATITQRGDSLMSGAVAGNQWYVNGAVIPGATGQFIVPDQSGEYTVVVQGEDCSTSASRMFLVTAVEQPVGAGVSVFPNPVVTKATIDFGAPLHNVRRVSVVSAMGVEVIVMDVTTGSANATVDLSGLTAGVYVMRIVGGEGMIEKKIIKK